MSQKTDNTGNKKLQPFEVRVKNAMKKDAPVVVIETTEGIIEVALNTKKAPISSKNFLNYVAKGHYKNTIFHRVMSNFMIQGGGYDTHKIEKNDLVSPIKNEAKNGLKNLRGTIAMARTGQINSAKAQFYINVVDNPGLDHGAIIRGRKSFGYAVFGKVIKGMETVDKIRFTKTQNLGGPFANLPVKMVVIKNMRIKD